METTTSQTLSYTPSVSVKVLNVTSTIHGLNNVQEAALDAELSFWSEGFIFTPQYKSGVWDGRVHLFKKSTSSTPYGKFPSGLLSRVFNLLDTNGIPVQVEDQRSAPPKEPELSLLNFELRDYQKAAVDIAVERGRGLFRLPTASGKTVVVAGIVGKLNVPTLVISHRQEILSQIENTLSLALGVKVGRIQGETKEINRFNVGMIQTIHSAFERHEVDPDAHRLVQWIKNDCKCIILDEAHHSVMKTLTYVMNRAFESYYRFGVSATIDFGQMKDLSIESNFGKVQMSITPSDMIKQKRLSKPYIFFVDYGDKSTDSADVTLCSNCGSTSLKTIRRAIGRGKAEKSPLVSSYDDDPLELTRKVYVCNQCGKEWNVYTSTVARCLVENEERNNAIAQLVAERMRKNMSVLVLVNFIEHGKIIHEKLAKLVDPSKIEFVWSGVEGRKDLLQQLKRKEKLCLVATQVYSEGIDVPCVVGSTEVPLLDGSIKTMKELFDLGAKDFWVYSVSEFGDIIPGKASRVVLSGKSVDTVKVLLDNGKFLMCTPDHLVMLRSGEYKVAGELKHGDSLMPLYRFLGNRGYDLVYLPRTKKTVATHRVIGDFLYGKQNYGRFGMILHHINFNKRDNRPDNLRLMSWESHHKYHVDGLAELNRLKWREPEYRERMTRLRQIYNRLPDKIRRQSESLKLTWAKNPSCMLKNRNEGWRRRISVGVKVAHLRGDFKSNSKFLSIASSMTKEHFISLLVHNMSKTVCKILKCSRPTLENVGKFFGISKFKPFMLEGIKLGYIVHPSKGRVWSPEQRRQMSETKRRKFDNGSYDGKYSMKAAWEHNVKVRGYRPPKFLSNNHKVVSVVKNGKEDVYDMEFVSPTNNFGVAPGIFVHNCLNSVVLARGTASEIDTLQSVGRALRRDIGKWKTVIFDFLDKSKVFHKRSLFRKKLLSQEKEFVIKDLKLNDDFTHGSRRRI